MREMSTETPPTCCQILLFTKWCKLEKLAYRDEEVAKTVCLSLGNISCKRTSVTGYDAVTASNLLNLLGETHFPLTINGCQAFSRPA